MNETGRSFAAGGVALRLGPNQTGVIDPIGFTHFAAHGARTIGEAIAFVADLKKKGRYQQDVY